MSLITLIMLGFCFLYAAIENGAAQGKIRLPISEYGTYANHPERQLLLHCLHMAGVERDGSELPALLEAIVQPTDRSMFYTALHAIAQIGDLSALPTLDELLTRLEGENDRDFVRNVRARLLATTEAQNHSDPQERSRHWLERFFAEIGYTPETLNTAVEANKHDVNHFSSTDVDGATRALYELADEIYLHRDLALLNEAKRMGVRFDIWKGVQYKVDLAPLSDEERLDWIINTLTINLKALTNDSFFLIQLAANQGLPASRKVAERLEEMDRKRADYASVLQGKCYYPSYSAMFDILSCVGDKATEPLLGQYVKDPEPTIRHYAKQSYPRVKEGMPTKYRVAY